MPALTTTLLDMIDNPTTVTIDSPHMTVIQSFIIKAFSSNCDTDDVNVARERMFKGSFEEIPPTKHALFQHTLRALLVAAFLWKLCLEKTPSIPSFSEWGWVWHTRLFCWVPYWTDKPDVGKGCSFLGQCSCRVACTGRCSCHRGTRRCTSFCKCQGTCSNNDRFNN